MDTTYREFLAGFKTEFRALGVRTCEIVGFK